MGQLVNINFEQQMVSARELHQQLNIATEFRIWMPRMIEYGFVEGKDFRTFLNESTGGRPSRDYEISMEMAKQICMIQRTPEGKRIREYLIELEDKWNTPELVMARALKMAAGQIDELKVEKAELQAKIEADKPKTIFADAVTASNSAILVRDLAKLIRQNGYDIGEKRLYGWMRENGYICKGTTMPTQRAMELGLFEIEIRTIERGTGLPLERKTTKVTGKGQVYFVNKFIA